MPGDHFYAYYKCPRLIRDGKNACSPNRLRTKHRAEEVEWEVWSNISRLMKDPEQLRGDIDRMIELETNSSHGVPEREEKVWLDKLAEVNRIRWGYQEQAAKGYMTYDELGAVLEKLEETRKSAERELQIVKTA